MRYAPLSKLQTRNKVTRITTVLFIIFMQNLYEKFHDKKKLIIFISTKLFKQHATRQNLGHAVIERFGSIRSLSENTSKAIAHGLTVQQQRRIKSIKHDTLPGICINDVRRYTMLPVDLAVAVKTPTRFRTLTSQQRKS